MSAVVAGRNSASTSLLEGSATEEASPSLDGSSALMAAALATATASTNGVGGSHGSMRASERWAWEQVRRRPTSNAAFETWLELTRVGKSRNST
eukprot:3008027-Pyramimonas_sp.AAC.1